MAGKRRLLTRVPVAVATALLLALALPFNWQLPRSTQPVRTATKHGLSLTPRQMRLVSGAAERALGLLGVPAFAAVLKGDKGLDEPTGAAAGTSVGAEVAGPGINGGPGNVVPGRNGTCAMSIGDNVRVNTDCENATDISLAGRAQARNETAIAANPRNKNQVIAGANDYRRGDGGCGTYFSVDGGRTWSGGLMPTSFVRGNVFSPPAPKPFLREYWQACGDTDVAWDSTGTAFFQAQVFNRGFPVTQDPDQSSAILIFRSDNGGASWNFPGRPVVATYDTTGDVLEDKPFMAIDANPKSPFADRIYVSWTEFRADGTAPILLAYSRDHGETFSKPVLVSASSPLCTLAYGLPTNVTTCNANQFSKPVVAADGSLYVIFANFNNPVSGSDNRNQMLVAKSTDGGVSFGPLIKAGDYYDLPDCATYQAGKDAGRACVPEKGPTTNSVFRAANYPSLAADPANSRHLVAHYGSYINRHSQESNGCVPAGFNPNTGNNLFTGVKTPGACGNDILVSETFDGGATWSGAAADPRAVAIVAPGGEKGDRFWQWTTMTEEGKAVVSFYDRGYGNDSTTGFSDVSVATERAVRRATSSSMPPPTQFAGVFLGDYAQMTLTEDGAMPIWADTRNPGVTSCPADVRKLCTFGNTQDVFTTRVELP